MNQLSFVKVCSVFFVLMTLGCEKSSETVISTPNVVVSCDTTDSNLCEQSNPNGATAFVVLTRSGCDASDFDPVATGSEVMTCDNTGCQVTISRWLDENSNTVTEILSGSIDVCATVDLDDTQSIVVTASDLTTEITRVLSDSETITVDSWD